MMLVEEGIVVDVEEDKVLVQPQRSDRCEGCSPEFCFSDDRGGLIIEAKDTLGVKVGQRVRLAIREQSLFWYSFLLYGMPLLGLLVGAFLGHAIGIAVNLEGGSSLLAIGLGLLLMVISFLGGKRYIQRLDREQTYRPSVVEIIDGSL